MADSLEKIVDDMIAAGASEAEIDAIISETEQKAAPATPKLEPREEQGRPASLAPGRNPMGPLVEDDNPYDAKKPGTMAEMMADVAAAKKRNEDFDPVQRSTVGPAWSMANAASMGGASWLARKVAPEAGAKADKLAEQFEEAHPVISVPLKLAAAAKGVPGMVGRGASRAATALVKPTTALGRVATETAAQGAAGAALGAGEAAARGDYENMGKYALIGGGAGAAFGGAGATLGELAAVEGKWAGDDFYLKNYRAARDSGRLEANKQRFPGKGDERVADAADVNLRRVVDSTEKNRVADNAAFGAREGELLAPKTETFVHKRTEVDPAKPLPLSGKWDVSPEEEAALRKTVMDAMDGSEAGRTIAESSADPETIRRALVRSLQGDAPKDMAIDLARQGKATLPEKLRSIPMRKQGQREVTETLTRTGTPRVPRQPVEDRIAQLRAANRKDTGDIKSPEVEKLLDEMTAGYVTPNSGIDESGLRRMTVNDIRTMRRELGERAAWGKPLSETTKEERAARQLYGEINQTLDESQPPDLRDLDKQMHVARSKREKVSRTLFGPDSGESVVTGRDASAPPGDESLALDEAKEVTGLKRMRMAGENTKASQDRRKQLERLERMGDPDVSAAIRDQREVMADEATKFGSALTGSVSWTRNPVAYLAQNARAVARAGEEAAMNPTVKALTGAYRDTVPKNAGPQTATDALLRFLLDRDDKNKKRRTQR